MSGKVEVVLGACVEPIPPVGAVAGGEWGEDVGVGGGMSGEVSENLRNE